MYCDTHSYRATHSHRATHTRRATRVRRFTHVHTQHYSYRYPHSQLIYAHEYVGQT